MHLFGLLYVSEHSRRHANLVAGSDPLDVYLRCGVTLAKSCYSAGLPFSIITNSADLLRQRLVAIGGSAEIVGIDFSRAIPVGIPFYEAHFKLDVLAAFASGSLGPQLGLVDLDAVLLAPVDGIDLDQQGVDFLAYRLNGDGDKWDTLEADLLRAGADPSGPLDWYGGEFIAGSVDAFSRLSAEIEALWPIYLGNLDRMQHVGDESIVSAALSNLRLRGAVVTDGSRAPVPFTIARWWSSRTLAPQQRFADIDAVTLLHLPSDKEFLAGYAKTPGPFEPEAFLRAYRSYVARKLLPRRLANVVQGLAGRRRMYVPRL